MDEVTAKVSEFYPGITQSRVWSALTLLTIKQRDHRELVDEVGTVPRLEGSSKE